MRRLIAAALVAASAFMIPAAADAQAAPTVQCKPSAMTQFDMAGTYIGDDIILEMYPCGGSYVEWQNDYGQHYATYYTVQRLPGGEKIARGISADPSTRSYLDGVAAMGVKPAEIGFIQIVTNGPLGVRVYRLAKIF